MLYRPAVICVYLLFFVVHVFAQASDKYNLSTDTTVNRLAGAKRFYFSTRIENRPKIDGKLSDPCWDTGIWSGGFIQQVPNQGKKPSQETEIKILYDDNNLYVGFKCFDKGP